MKVLRLRLLNYFQWRRRGQTS